jgi:hypothetical protein
LNHSRDFFKKNLLTPPFSRLGLKPTMRVERKLIQREIKADVADRKREVSEALKIQRKREKPDRK